MKRSKLTHLLHFVTLLLENYQIEYRKLRLLTRSLSHAQHKMSLFIAIYSTVRLQVGFSLFVLLFMLIKREITKNASIINAKKFTLIHCFEFMPMIVLCRYIPKYSSSCRDTNKTIFRKISIWKQINNLSHFHLLFK